MVCSWSFMRVADNVGLSQRLYRESRMSETLLTRVNVLKPCKEEKSAEPALVGNG